MKILKTILVISITSLLLSCGGDNNITPTRLVKPRWIAASNSEVTIKNYSTRVVYVANFIGGDIFPIDTEKRKTIDTDLFNDGLTPIAVAGGLGQIIVRDSLTEGFSFDIYVASKLEKAIYLIRAKDSGATDERYLEHTLVDIGDTEVCASSKPYFDDKDNVSNPSMGDVEIQTGNARTENWLVRYSGGDKAYSIEGSVSGLLSSMAKENETYSNDEVGLSFKIFSGSRETTNKDNFTFGATCSKPLLVGGVPATFIFTGGKLYVALEDKPKIEIYNESDFSYDTEIDLSGGSGDFVPSMIVEFNEKLYISNLSGTEIAIVDLSDNSVTFHDVGDETSYLSKVSGIDDKLYLIPVNSKKLIVFSLNTNTVDDELALYEYPRSFIEISDGSNGEKRALVSNVTSYLYEIDLTNLQIVDQEQRSGTNSSAGKSIFYDVDPNSGPDLTGINTVDGLTRTESWMLNYNGAIPGTFSLTGEITDNLLNDVNADFSASGIVAGDILVIDPSEGSKEEIEIDSVTDGQNIILASNPLSQGADTIYQIRSEGNYVVSGSESGLQMNRVYEGTPYITDNGSMTFTVIASLNDPTTEGDYFTFFTYDGVELLELRSKMLPLHMANTVRISDSREFVYVANEGSNNVSIVDIKDMKETNTID